MMGDTDWRPSPCPECGAMREATQYPVCTKPDCPSTAPKNPPTPGSAEHRGDPVLVSARKVEGFKDEAGNIHEHLSSAVFQDVKRVFMELECMNETECQNLTMELIADDWKREKLVNLLQELD